MLKDSWSSSWICRSLLNLSVSTAKCAQRFMVFIMNMSIITESQCLNCKMCSKIHGLHHEYVDHYWNSVSQLQNVLKDSWSSSLICRSLLKLSVSTAKCAQRFMAFIMNMSIITECQCLNCKMCSKIHGLHHEYVDHYWMSVSQLQNVLKDSWSSSWICRSLLNVSVSTAKCAQRFMVFINWSLLNVSVSTAKCAQRFMVFIMNMSITTECHGLHHEYVDHYWISVSQLQNVLKDSWSSSWICRSLLNVSVSTAKCAQRFMVFIMNMSIITECQCLNYKMCSKIHGLHHEYVDHYWISVSQLQNVLKDSWSSSNMSIITGQYLNCKMCSKIHGLHHEYVDHYWMSVSQLQNVLKDSWTSSWICRSLLNLSVSTAKCAQRFMVFIMNMSIITECQCLNYKMCSKIHGSSWNVDHYWISVSQLEMCSKIHGLHRRHVPSVIIRELSLWTKFSIYFVTENFMMLGNQKSVSFGSTSSNLFYLLY